MVFMFPKMAEWAAAMQHLTVSDLVIIFTAVGGFLGFIVTVVTLAVKLQKFIADQFSNHRKLMYGLFSQRDRAIRRLEFWAVQQGSGFQPGADPLEFGSGNGHDEN